MDKQIEIYVKISESDKCEEHHQGSVSWKTNCNCNENKSIPTLMLKISKLINEELETNISLQPVTDNNYTYSI